MHNMRMQLRDAQSTANLKKKALLSKCATCTDQRTHWKLNVTTAEDKINAKETLVLPHNSFA